MNCLGRLSKAIAVWMALAWWFIAAPSAADVAVYTDRSAFLAAIGAPSASDDFEAYAAGAIGNGATLGSFSYGFAATVEPAVVAGGFGGQALGARPFDVFVGGDAVSLSFAGAASLRAFGLDVLYAPSFDLVPAGIYRVRVDDGLAAGAFAGSPGLDSADGRFFLGLVADPGSEFRQLTLLSVAPADANGDPLLVPAYQFDDIAFGTAPAVAEPTTWLLMLAGLSMLARLRRFPG